MRHALFLLAPLLLTTGCPLDTGGGVGGGGGTGTRVAGTLTIFQGAKSAPVQPTLAGLRPAQKKKVVPDIPVRQLLGGTALPISIAGDPPRAAAVTEWIAGQIILRFDEKLTAPKALGLLKAPVGTVLTHHGFASEYLHVIRATRKDGTTLTVAETLELAATLKKTPGVRFTEVDQWQHAFAVPNDKLYSAQWHYPALNLPATWDITQGSANVVVADIDTGIVPHPDLDPRVIAGIDMISDTTNAGDGSGRDDNPNDEGGDLPNGGSSWHGSHTAGTIGAATNNTVGVAGVDWNCKLLPVRVLGTKGGALSDIAAGMAWATGQSVPGSRANSTPAKVVNMSLGGTSDASPTYQDVIDTANANGAVFVIAAGNNNQDAQRTIPCIQSGVICVGATRFTGKRASYSNFGAAVTVMAPGGEVSEDANGDGYPDGVLSTLRDKNNMASLEFSQGTSMATPHVTGVVALMKAVNPTLTFTQARAHLTTTANPAFQCTEGCGAGMVNAQAAVLAAKGSPPTGPAKLSVTATELFFSQGSSTVTVGVSNLGAMPLNVMVSKSGAAAASVSFPKGTTATVAAGQTGSIEVAASLTGLADGTHAAQIAINSNGGEATVNVKIRVGGGSMKNAEVGLAFLGSDGMWKVAGTAVATAASGYAYSIDAQPGKYFVVGAMDENGNDMLDDGEPIGLYPTRDSPQEVTVAEGQQVTNIDFPLAPSKPITDDTAAGIGAACTTTCSNGAQCITAWPGGYCSLDCKATTCPLGSACIGSTNLFCLATCTGPGAGQSTCRSSYVCYSDGSGRGVCLPRCSTDPDCGAGSTCDVASGYCL